MTLPEYISDNDWGALRRVVQLVFKVLIDTGGRSIGIRWGTDTLVFTASTDSASLTVTHGLGRAPIVVLAIANNAPTFADIPAFNARTLTTTTFVINGHKTTASTVNVGFYWMALG